MNVVPIELRKVKEQIAAGRRAVVGATDAGDVWIRAIGPEDVVPLDGTEGGLDYESILELGGRFEVGGAVAHLRWTKTVDQAYRAACDMLAPAQVESAQVSGHGIVLQISGSRSSRARIVADIERRWASKADQLISHARALRIVPSDDVTLVVATIHALSVALVDALMRPHKKVDATVRLVTERADASLGATYERGSRLGRFEVSPLHRGRSQISVSGPGADLDRFGRETAKADPDDGLLYALRIVEAVRERDGAALVLLHNHTDVRVVPVGIELVAQRFPTLQFDVAIVPQDVDQACLTGNLQGASAEWRPLSHDETRDHLTRVRSGRRS